MKSLVLVMLVAFVAVSVSNVMAWDRNNKRITISEQ
jgi:hypothetical protein